MKLIFFLSAVIAVCCSAEARLSKAKVQVYSLGPGEFGKENTLMCRVSGFHPPDINIELLKHGVEIHDTKLTDLAFGRGWFFHLMKSVSFTPTKDDTYLCRVTHHGITKDYAWQPNM